MAPLGPSCLLYDRPGSSGIVLASLGLALPFWDWPCPSGGDFGSSYNNITRASVLNQAIDKLSSKKQGGNSLQNTLFNITRTSVLNQAIDKLGSKKQLGKRCKQNFINITRASVLNQAIAKLRSKRQ